MNVKLIREDKENFNKITYKYSIPLQVKRKISVIDLGIKYLLDGVYGTRRICSDYAGYDEFIQVVSEAVAEKMYYYHFSDLDDIGKEWEKIYYGIMEYMDIAWGDKLEEHFESICNKNEVDNVIKEEAGNRVKKFLYDKFDKVFNNTEFDGSDMYNMIWYNNKGKKIFTRNWWGALWINDCEIYRELRLYSKLVSMYLDTFETYLIDYLNQRYKKEFDDRPLKTVGDEDRCIDED